MVSMVSDAEILELLNEVGAVITDSHFVYASWKHGSSYVNKDALYAHPRETERLCYVIARNYLLSPCRIDTVIGPAIGAVILAQWIAYHLNFLKKWDIAAVYAEKMPNGETFVIKRGYDQFIAGRHILVVADILTTGGSAQKVVDAVRALGGNVVAVAALCNRGGVTKEDLGNVPELFALLNITMEAWDESLCPLCAQNVPIDERFGHGREYLARRDCQKRSEQIGF